MLATLTLLLGQVSMPLAQAWHEWLESVPGAAPAMSAAGRSVPHPSTPERRHDADQCPLCRSIHSVRQAFFLPPPALVGTLEPRREWLPLRTRIDSVSAARPSGLGARGPPAA